MHIQEKHKKWWILSAMTSCVSMIFVDITVLPVALPTIQRYFEASATMLQWILNSYTLTLGVFVITGGKLGDLWGRKKCFFLGLALFSLASASCAISQHIYWFIFSRALQGIGAAILIPTTYSILLTSFPQQERGKALGTYMSVGSIFLSLGPLIGGSLTEFFSWRLIFFINIPIALIGFILSKIFVVESVNKKAVIDIKGFFFLSIGIVSMILPIMQGNFWGWWSIKTLSLFALSIILLYRLYQHEKLSLHPFIDFKLYKKKTFLGANICILCNQLQISVTVYWAIYIQNILHYTPAQAGMLGIIANLPIFFMGPIAGFLSDRCGPKIPVTFGFIFVFLSLATFTLHPDPSLNLLLAIFIFYGCGVRLIYTPSIAFAMEHVNDQKKGMISGMTATLRQIGSTLGIAVFTALFINKETMIFFYDVIHNPSLSNVPTFNWQGIIPKIPSSIAFVESLPHQAASDIMLYAKEAYKAGFVYINAIASLIAVIGIILSWLLFPKNQITKKIISE
jgi:EmrB/QacA subfamily drug resistance transporter